MSPSASFLPAALACAGACGTAACTFVAAPGGDRTAAERAAKPAAVVTGAPAR